MDGGCHPADRSPGEATVTLPASRLGPAPELRGQSWGGEGFGGRRRCSTCLLHTVVRERGAQCSRALWSPPHFSPTLSPGSTLTQALLLSSVGLVPQSSRIPGTGLALPHRWHEMAFLSSFSMSVRSKTTLSLFRHITKGASYTQHLL